VITALLADNDVQGQVRHVIARCQSAAWAQFWAEVQVLVLDLQDVGLPANSPDAVVWDLCQRRDLVLITGNRNLEGPDALEAVIRTRGNSQHLPVFTLADRARILRDPVYADRVVARLIELLSEVDDLRGSGRLYLP
jgi:hypothetical protein